MSGILRRLLWIAALLTVGWGAPALAQRTALTTAEGLYPRVVRLSNSATPANNGRIVASVVAFPGGNGEAQIFGSDNGGTSFTRIGTVNDPLFARGLCCGGLYELPRQIGTMPAGTLLWAGSVGGTTPAQPMQLRIYRSTDRGATWSYLSNCATGAVNRGTEDGLWEAEFTVAADGSLVCFYSDETVPGFSQMIQRVTSTDGVTWSAPVRVVASGVTADRPGMAIVTKLPSGRYFMTFELCGPAGCTVFYKTSPDGLDWGSASNVGTRVETEDGRWFLHTPTNTWAPVPGTPNGRIFVNGQILSSASGVSSGNGRTIFYNDSVDGSGKWKTLTAPVAVPGAANNPCQNYSSPLLVSTDGRTILGLASDYDGSVCKTFFGTASAIAPLALNISAPAMSLSAGQSGTSLVTLTPSGGFTGSVKLTVSVPNFAGTATFDRDTLTFTGTAAQTATLTLRSTQTAALGGSTSGGGGGFALASVMGGVSLMLFSALRNALGVAALGLVLALSGCSGGSSSSGGGGGTIVTPVTPLTYTATVTATDTANPANKTETTIAVTLYR